LLLDRVAAGHDIRLHGHCRFDGRIM